MSTLSASLMGISHDTCDDYGSMGYGRQEEPPARAADGELPGRSDTHCGQ